MPGKSVWRDLRVSGRDGMLARAEWSERELFALAETLGRVEIDTLLDIYDRYEMPRWSQMIRREIKALLARWQICERSGDWSDCAICGNFFDGGISELL